jgi:hypothetical protein
MNSTTTIHITEEELLKILSKGLGKKVTGHYIKEWFNDSKHILYVEESK